MVIIDEYCWLSSTVDESRIAVAGRISCFLAARVNYSRRLSKLATRVFHAGQGKGSAASAATRNRSGCLISRPYLFGVSFVIHTYRIRRFISCPSFFGSAGVELLFVEEIRIVVSPRRLPICFVDATGRVIRLLGQCVFGLMSVVCAGLLVVSMCSSRKRADKRNTHLRHAGFARKMKSWVRQGFCL